MTLTRICVHIIAAFGALHGPARVSRPGGPLPTGKSLLVTPSLLPVTRMPSDSVGPRMLLSKAQPDIWKPIPVHKPPILCHIPYPMDMTWILQHRVYFLAKCHIHVISNPCHIFFSKKIYLDIPGIS